MQYPNVILITCDELRGDCPGYMGNPDCQTPCLDRFSERGVVFTKHFAVHGKCVPSRISMMTGRYPHTDGFRTIGQKLPSGSPNLVGTLKELGYETAVFGLNHVWEDFWGDNKKASGYVDYHSFTKDSFDHLNDREWPVPDGGMGQNALAGLQEGGEKAAVTCISSPLTGHCDDNRTEQSLHYLREVRDRDRPFYLQLNLSRPHPPYEVEEPYFSMYDRTAITPWPHDLPANAPLHMRKNREIRGVDEQMAKELQAVYYGMVTKVDSLVGKVMDELFRQGLEKNSLIVFTVDHGDFAGQYCLNEKWDTAMNDCLLHVPLILMAPGLPCGNRVASLSEHVDMAPTILALLGLQPEWGVHGESLLPVVAGGIGKKTVFADGGHEEAMWNRFNHQKIDSDKQRVYRTCPETMARTKMARTDKWKLVERLTGGNELYDMENDPYETNNLWGREDYAGVISELRGEMIQWCLRTDTDRPRQEKVGA